MSSKESKPGKTTEVSVKDSSMDTQNTDKTKARRSLLKKLAVGGVAGAAMPTQWSKPVIDAVVLPVHAQTSNVVRGGGGGSGGPGPAPANSLGDELLDLLVSPASAIYIMPVENYCLEVTVSTTAGVASGVTVTKACYNLCEPGKYIDRFLLPTELTGSGSTWSGSVDGRPLTLTNVDPAAATLANSNYDGANGVIINGGSCNCGPCGMAPI